MLDTRRTMGLEIEYGFMLLDALNNVCMADNDKRLAEAIGAVCNNGTSQKRDWLPGNGGCIYRDVGCHPEYASPECLEGYQVALHDRVGERILVKRAERYNRRHAKTDGLHILLVKNNEARLLNEITNSGHAGGGQVSYGHHESYQLSRAVSPNPGLNPLVAFLFSRIILTGNGRLVIKEGKTVFELSQRAPHISRVYSTGTTESADRGFICTRSEGDDVDPSRWLRFQIIGADASILDGVTALAFDITSLLLLMIEQHALKGVNLFNPVAELPKLNANHNHRLQGDNRTWSAVEIQECYLSEAQQFVRQYELENRYAATLTQWQWFLERYRQGPEALVGVTGWATKMALWDRWIDRHGEVDADGLARLATNFDLACHTVAGGPSLVSQMRRLDRLRLTERHILRANSVPPPTRAVVRADLIRRSKSHPQTGSIGWMRQTWNGHQFWLRDSFDTSLDKLDGMTDLIMRELKGQEPEVAA